MDEALGDTLVVWNAGAGSAVAARELHALIGQTPGVRLLETEVVEQGSLESHLADTVRCVIAAGGDGTVNHVLNAVRNSLDRIAFGVLPLGTGNDLCRSLGIPLDPLDAWQVLRAGRTRPIDMVRVRTDGQERLFVNVANGGNSNRVSECMTDELKSRWGAWCYLRGAIDVLTDLRGFDTTVRLDDGPPERFLAWNVIVANGRTAAGGTEVAPRANLEDGRLEVILVLDQTPLDMAGLMAEFFLGDWLSDDRVVYRRARKVEITMHPPSNFVIDGESFSGQPIRFDVLPESLRAIVGPSYAGGAVVRRGAGF